MNPFPALYHAHHSRHREDLPFWLELARRSGGPVLELGCGTGRVLLHLAEAGMPIWGLDNNAEMLKYMRGTMQDHLSPLVRIWQGDLRSFRLDKRFALILLPCNTLSTLQGERVRGVFTLAYDHLLPRGMFAAALPNPAMLMDLPATGEPEAEEEFPHPMDGKPVQVSSEWQREGRKLILLWHYDHLQADGSVHRISAQTNHLLAPANFYRRELLHAGFTNVRRFGDYDKSPYSPESPHFLITAQRH